MWNKSILLLLTISGLIAQEDNSFNFQSNGANEDYVKVRSDAQNQPTAGMTSGSMGQANGRSSGL